MVPVPKGTLAGWCRPIALTADQAAAIRERTGSRRGVPRDTQRKRRAEVERIRDAARRLVPTLIGDPLWVAGVALYWAEGAKTKRMLAMTNSDPRILRTFVAWVRTYIDAEAVFALSLHLHQGNSEAAAKDYWRETLGLRGAQYWKTFIKPSPTGHRKIHLEHGVCRVFMRRSADASLTAMAWADVLAVELALGRCYPAPGSLAQLARATDS